MSPARPAIPQKWPSQKPCNSPARICAARGQMRRPVRAAVALSSRRGAHKNRVYRVSMGRSRATHVRPPQSPPITPPPRSRVNLASKGALNDKSLTDITKNTPKRVVPSNKILSGRGFYSDTRSIIMLRILRCRPDGIRPGLGRPRRRTRGLVQRLSQVRAGTEPRW
jgi:hypothetical protein